MARGDLRIPVIEANAGELADHEKLLESIEATTGEPALFRASRRQ
jgi:hypothetical protein